VAVVSETSGDGLGETRGRASAHRLMVVAVDAADAVTAAGGLVFDTVCAGWAVDLYLETTGDERALQILGVSGRPLSDGFDCEPDWPDAIFLAADLHRRHSKVRRLMRDADRRQRTDVAIWGHDCPADLATSVGTEHRLSQAAAAFKRHAMDAAGLIPQVAPTEPFRSRSPAMPPLTRP
jgi:hypothetical protein